MASSPSRSPAPEVVGRIVRTPRGLSELHPRSAVGRAARGCRDLAHGFGTATSARPGALASPALVLPAGVWPRREEAGIDDAIAAGLDPALARYAAVLRQRRARAVRQAPPKVLPLLVRRGGDTRLGPGTGPGGLARRSRPTDEPVAPLEARLERDPRVALRPPSTAPADGAPTPTSGRRSGPQPQRR